MMSDNNVKYYVNRDKRTVVCVLSGCRWNACNRITKQVQNYEYFINPLGEFRIKDEYVGIAKCSPEDTWDEDYGQKLAFARARKKRDEAINEQVAKVIDALRASVDKLSRYGYIYVSEPDIEQR